VADTALRPVAFTRIELVQIQASLTATMSVFAQSNLTDTSPGFGPAVKATRNALTRVSRVLTGGGVESEREEMTDGADDSV